MPPMPTTAVFGRLFVSAAAGPCKFWRTDRGGLPRCSYTNDASIVRRWRLAAAGAAGADAGAEVAGVRRQPAVCLAVQSSLLVSAA